MFKIICGKCGMEVPLYHGENIENINENQLQVLTTSLARCTQITIKCPNCKEETILYA